MPPGKLTEVLHWCGEKALGRGGRRETGVGIQQAWAGAATCASLLFQESGGGCRVEELSRDDYCFRHFISKCLGFLFMFTYVCEFIPLTGSVGACCVPAMGVRNGPCC